MGMQLREALGHFVDFCYPRVCALCDQDGAAGTEVCIACLEKVRDIERLPACERCAKPVAEPGALCPHCLQKGHPPFERIVRLGLYRDPVRELILQMKYHRRWTLAEFLGERMSELPDVKDLLSDDCVVMAVPLHPWRQFSRGFNQAEVIARRVAKRCGRKFVSPLVRLKNTETQTHLHDKGKRFDNLRDAFGLLRPRQVAGKRVIVVDDVMTTGATLESAARCLKEAEPASISAIVAAVADPREKDFEAI